MLGEEPPSRGEKISVGLTKKGGLGGRASVTQKFTQKFVIYFISTDAEIRHVEMLDEVSDQFRGARRPSHDAGVKGRGGGSPLTLKDVQDVHKHRRRSVHGRNPGTFNCVLYAY